MFEPVKITSYLPTSAGKKLISQGNLFMKYCTIVILEGQPIKKMTIFPCNFPLIN